MIAHLDGQFEFANFIGPEERRVLRKALARMPEDRYPNCTAFAENLATALAREAGRGIEVGSGPIRTSSTSTQGSRSGPVQASGVRTGAPRPNPIPPSTERKGPSSTSQATSKSVPSDPKIKSIRDRSPSGTIRTPSTSTTSRSVKPGSGTIPALPHPQRTGPSFGKLVLAAILAFVLAGAAAFLLWMLVIKPRRPATEPGVGCLSPITPAVAMLVEPVVPSQTRHA